MAKTQYLVYTIYLTDAALVAELQATPHAGGAIGATILAPTVAATTYSAPIQEESTTMAAPCIRSEWFTAGNNFPRDQRTFQRKSGGWFGIPLLFGTTTNYYWRGVFKWAPVISATPPVGVTKVAMALRRWVDGFELPDNGEAGTGNLGSHATRGASRHLQGFGQKIDSTANSKTHTVAESGGATTSRGWERFYIRVRRLPSAGKTRLWKTTGGGSPNAGIELGILPSGQLTITNIDSLLTETLLATVPTAIPVHVWKKIDIIYAYKSTVKGTEAEFHLYINGVLQADLTGTTTTFASVGLGQDQLVVSSTLGNSTAGNGLTWDVDDWIGSEWPTGTAGTPASVGTFPGEDWNHGSRVAFVSATGFAADNAASWAAAGNFRTLRQRPVVTVPNSKLSNATSGARLSITTDAALEIDRERGQLGMAAMTVGAFAFETGSLNANLGYKLPGGAAVLASVVQGNANYAWKSAWYQPTMINPLSPMAGLELIFEHGVGVSTQNIQCLAAACEIIGVFGQEDIVASATNQVASETPAVPENDATQTAAYVATVKARLVSLGVSLAGACGAFEITKRVAWGLRLEGAGYLVKTTGNNCGGFAVDQLCFPSGRIVDVLGDAGGTNTPSYNEGVDVTADRYSLPVDPGDAGSLAATAEHLGYHNAPYPRSPWARRGTAPFAPVVLMTGTYVGTGTFIDLPFRAPPCFVVIRALTGFAGGHFWWSSHSGGHIGGQQGYQPGCPVDALVDPAFPVGAPALDAQEQQYLFRIVGNQADSNAVGVVYQFTAFCDPAERFCIAGVLNVTAGGTDIVTTLDNEGFTPEAAFVMQEIAAGGATVGLHYKGLGHGANNCSPLNAAEIAGLAMSKGALTSRAALNAANTDVIASLVWRRNDGSGDANLAKVLAVTSYVGDGSASRTVGLPMGGMRPVWALVVPHGGASFYRDASHTGTISMQFPTTVNAATGITGGGLDSLSVGSALNTNGVTYDVFVLPGSATNGNGGFSTNGEFIPIEPNSPTGGDTEGAGLWDSQPPDPELSPDEPGTTTSTGGTGGTGGTGDDFGTGCVAATTAIINRALTNIGVSKRVVDIVNELSEEASNARLLYADDVGATLRAFPWPFATRYARLVLVAGTSTAKVNNDWRYSYRAPSDMMFARRITNPNQIARDYDPAPVKFRLGADDTGLLIYTDQAPTDDNSLTPELEYTIRTDCAASQGDGLFRTALAWRHAASLAPVLAKDDKKAAFCWQMFKATIGTAQTAAAQEVQQAPPGDAEWITGRE